MIIFIKHYGLLSLFLITIIILGFVTFSFSSIMSGALQGLFNMKSAAVVDASNSVVRLVLLIFLLVLIGHGLFSSLIAYFGSGVFALGLASLIIKKNKINIRFASVNKKALKDIIDYSLFITLSGFLLGLMWFSSRWFLSLRSLKQAAIFDTGFLAYGIFQMGFASAVVALVPYVSRLASNSNEIPKLPLIKTIVKPYVVGILILFLVRCSEIDLIFFQHVGLSTYQESLPVFYIAFLAIPFDLFFGLSSGILQGLGKTKELFLTVIVIFPVHIFGSWILCYLKGPKGAAGMVVITYFLLSLINMRKVRKYEKCDIREYSKVPVPPTN